MSVKLLTEHHLEFLSLTGGCADSSQSTNVKMPHCWKSHVAAHFISLQGMRYLQNSDIKVHGRLRSSQCVVDSRFMLKIKGFGPKSFIEIETKVLDRISMNYSSEYSNIIWCKPLTLNGQSKQNTSAFLVC